MLTTDDLPRQGLGCMRMTADTAGDPDRDPAAVIGAALDAGVTMLDTAHMYGNEALVGRALAARRAEVVLATKFGVLWHETGGREDGDWYVRADAAFVRESCEASLRRLGVDTIDLFYLHHRSADTPVEETVGAMAELLREGKIRGIGLSNVTAEDVRRAVMVHPVVAVQEQWSLTERGVEAMLPAIVAAGAAVVAHSPTDHGALHRGGTVAGRHGMTPGQVALAWVHHRAEMHGLPVVPLPGTTSVAHLRENVAARELELDAEDLAELENVPRAE